MFFANLPPRLPADIGRTQTEIKSTNTWSNQLVLPIRAIPIDNKSTRPPASRPILIKPTQPRLDRQGHRVSAPELYALIMCILASYPFLYILVFAIPRSLSLEPWRDWMFPCFLHARLQLSLLRHRPFCDYGKKLVEIIKTIARNIRKYQSVIMGLIKCFESLRKLGTAHKKGMFWSPYVGRLTWIQRKPGFRRRTGE
ncbi:uncharacterized protein EI97DRAFT_461233 [Westerdykella ornata]|uniref:Uncharacterized protein n=1 Tax=Westerdykella ornata TaxID=318751 RepID=A0A6A6JAK9_WESOR|nr:uncharacterized protein EI97DRAFT_461233 [Westerdykella ornata]KAF2273355.1 hypothetical protein EI97DRAFT_461233 [Westerdykella ornata]